jgi:hypothetical protein
MNELRNARFDEQISLDISHLPVGMYIITIRGNKLLYFGKIVKTD